MIDFKVDEKTYYLSEPKDADIAEAEVRRVKARNMAIANGSLIEAQVRAQAEEKGIWSNQKEAETEAVRKEINELLDKIDAGGYDFDEAVTDAKRVTELRAKILELVQPLNELLSYSAESQGQDAFDDYLMSKTILNQNKRPVFSSYEKFIAAKVKNSQIIIGAILAKNNGNLDFFRELPENKFLIDYGRLDKEDLAYLDEDGNKETVVEEPEKVEFKPFTKNGKEVKPVGEEDSKKEE